MAMRNYTADKESFKNFFIDFCQTDDEGHKFFKYSEQLTKVAHREQVTFVVDLDDLHETNEELSEAVMKNTRRYTNMVSDVLYEMLPEYKRKDVVAKDALDVYIEHRIMLEARNHRIPGEMRDPRNRYPPELIRRFEVYFEEMSTSKSVPIREVKTEHIGKLLTVRALRRAKRRNMERLMYMCGGNIISEVSQLDVRNLGYCAKVKVVNIGEEKYTFLEGTPFKGSCTILICADTENEMNKMNNAIRGTLKVLHDTYKEKKIISGGINLYQKLVKFLNLRLNEVNEEDVVGYEVLKQAYTNMIKYLLRNEGSNVHEKLIKILREGVTGIKIWDSFDVVSGVLNNSAIVAMSLLMVDEIIKAGKCVKEEKMSN